MDGIWIGEGRGTGAGTADYREKTKSLVSTSGNQVTTSINQVPLFGNCC